MTYPPLPPGYAPQPPSGYPQPPAGPPGYAPAPQNYPQPPTPAGPPPGYGYPQQGYQGPGPAQGYPAPNGYGQPAAAPQDLPQVTGVDPLSSGGKSPKPRNLIGRTCAIVVHTAGSQEYKGAMRANIKADLYVLDGGPVTYGDTEEPVGPATHQSDTPAFFPGVLMSGIVAEDCGPYAGTGQPVIGRFQRGTTNARAQLFVPLGAALDEQKEVAAQKRAEIINLIARHRAPDGHPQKWTSPTPVELAKGPAIAPQGYPQQPPPAGPPVNYAAPPPMQAPPAGPPGYPGAAIGQPTMPYPGDESCRRPVLAGRHDPRTMGPAVTADGPGHPCRVGRPASRDRLLGGIATWRNY